MTDTTDDTAAAKWARWMPPGLTRPHEELIACWAHVFRFEDPANMPLFCSDDDIFGDDQRERAIQAWLRPRGLAIVSCRVEVFRATAPIGLLSIALYTDENGVASDARVCDGGVVVFNPSPAGAEPRGVLAEHLVFVAFDPGVMARDYPHRGVLGAEDWG